MTKELNQKDNVIQQLNERLQHMQAVLDNSIMNASQNMHNSNVHMMENSPSATDLQRIEQPTLQTTNTTGGMVSQLRGAEKSADRAQKMTSNGNTLNTKEINRDVQRLKKSMKEKDKELLKLKD